MRALFLALVCISTAVAAREVAFIPIDIQDGGNVATIWVDGVKLKTVIDTSGYHSVGISPCALRKLNVRFRETFVERIDGAGRRFRGREFEIAELRIGTGVFRDVPRKVLTAELSVREGALIQVGQRARAFQMSARSSMYQAKITRVVARDDRADVEATLTGTGPNNDAPCILEIVADRERFLAVPNSAIIEEGGVHIVYVQHYPGMYMPMEIHTGIQGELYTQVLHGLDAGDEVVAFGSFFVDAEYKLKSSGGSGGAMGHEHHHH